MDLPESNTDGARTNLSVDNLNEAVANRIKDKIVVECALIELESLITSKEYISNIGISMDDIIYFSALYRLSVVKAFTQ